MKSKQYDSKAKLKSYHIILISCFLCLIFILNSNYVNEKRTAVKLEKENYSFFNKIISKRFLQETISEGGQNSVATKKSNEVCERGSKELRAYYETGDISSIMDSDEEKIECENEKKGYMQALIALVKKYVDENDTSTNEAEGGEDTLDEDDKKNIKKYLFHILPYLIFLVVGILSIIGWLICCCCNCCNCCCCCCCCKKTCCKIPCFIFTYIFYILAIAACIYGFTQSNKIFVGLSDTECSLLKLFEQVDEGEVKQTTPRWIGITKINELLRNLSNQINITKETALTDLRSKKNVISSKNETFNQQLDSFDEYCYNNGNYPTEYTKEFTDVTLNPYANNKYVLDIIKSVGHKDINGKYPEDTFLYNLNEEYSEISNKTDGYVNTSETSFNNILNEKSAEVMDNLNKAQKNLNELKDPFDKINNEIGDTISDNSKSIDKYGKLTVKLLFFVLILINLALGILLLLICLCSSKACTGCCCCRCLCKLFTHLFWNILAIIMFLSFIVGSILALVGTIGYDAMSLVSYMLSKENFANPNPFLLEKLGDAKKYLEICLHGNGSLEAEFDLGDSLNSIEEIDEVLLGLDNVSQRFKEIVKNLPSIKKFNTQIESRINYATDQFGLLGITDSNSNITLKDILPLFNQEIETNGNSESWGIDESIDTSNTCVSGSDSLIQGNYKFHISYCKPIDRDWITSITDPNSKIKNYAIMISEIVNKVEQLKDESNNSFKDRFKKLNNSYYEYMDSYDQMVNFLKETIGSLIGQIRNTVGNGTFFSFLNGKFIGTNIKIILKYLKYSLGEDIYKVGICLIIVGCSLILSISSTILLIVIINIGLEENIKDERNNTSRKGPEYNNSEERKFKF